MRTGTPLLVCIGLVIFSSCRKEEEGTPLDLDFASAADNARAEDAFADMLAKVDKAVLDNGLRDLCDPTVTFDTTSSPRTITLDFGDVNCTAANGRSHRGRIIVSYTGRYRDVGTVITITPQAYHVNDNWVQGTKTVTNLGLDVNGHIHFGIDVNGSLTAGDGSWTASHSAQRTRTWVEGSDTPAILDDVYEISGGGSGVNRNGLAYTLSIGTPLRIALDCPWITQGSVSLTPSGRSTRTIDYGSGSCDANFSVTVNGQTFNVIIG